MPQGANFPQAPPMTMGRLPTLVVPCRFLSIPCSSGVTAEAWRACCVLLFGIDVYSNPAELLAKSRRLRSFPEFQGANTNLAFHQHKSSPPSELVNTFRPALFMFSRALPTHLLHHPIDFS